MSICGSVSIVEVPVVQTPSVGIKDLIPVMVGAYDAITHQPEYPYNVYH
jgi:hypothetical protein